MGPVAGQSWGAEAEAYVEGVSPAMRAVEGCVGRVAAAEVPILIRGETGVGKSRLARHLHERSAHRHEPLTIIYGATATPAVFEGLNEGAGRTVLLEEVGELAPAAQDRLLQVLSARPGRRGARVISTTSRDLAAFAERQALRTDLRYRLDVVRLDIPPLRERPDDVVVFAEHFARIVAWRLRRDVATLSADARRRLLEHPWLGNVRELENCITESVLYAGHRRLTASDLRIRPSSSGASNPHLEFRALLPRLHAWHPDGFDAYAHRLILQWALEAAGGNRARAATLLGISRGTLRTRLRRLEGGRDDADGNAPSTGPAF